jgi:hypothetical protein
MSSLLLNVGRLFDDVLYGNLGGPVRDFLNLHWPPEKVEQMIKKSTSPLVHAI